jgi:predicted TIM-barrel enzyme
VFIGSGLTLDNVQDYYPICDAMIIGSHFKENGFWKNALSYERVSNFMERVKTL